MTIREVILRAAGELPQPFTLADLVVASWRKAPDRFCLAGYPQHPSSHRVSMEIMGRKPQSPIVLGYIARVAPNTYRLTDLGRAEIARLTGDTPGDDYAALRRVLDHPDFIRWQQSQERLPAMDAWNADLVALKAIFRRHAGRFVVGRPRAAGGRWPKSSHPPITPEQIGEGLAFLEVLMAGPRKRPA